MYLCTSCWFSFCGDPDLYTIGSFSCPCPIYNFINLFRLFQLSSWHSLSTCLGLHPLELQASVHSLGLFCWLILDLDAYHGPGSGELLRGLFYLVGSHWGHFVLLRVSFSWHSRGLHPPPLTPNRCPAYLLLVLSSKTIPQCYKLEGSPAEGQCVQRCFYSQ